MDDQAKQEKRRHSPELKAEVALEAIRGKFTTAELAEKYQVHPSLIHTWKKMLQENAAHLMESAKAASPDEEERKAKEKQIERLETENQWLQKILRRLPASERKAAVETDNPELPLLRQVKLLDINRSSIYYRKRSGSDANQNETTDPHQ